MSTFYFFRYNTWFFAICSIYLASFWNYDSNDLLTRWIQSVNHYRKIVQKWYFSPHYYYFITATSYFLLHVQIFYFSYSYYFYIDTYDANNTTYYVFTMLLLYISFSKYTLMSFSFTHAALSCFSLFLIFSLFHFFKIQSF